MQSSTLRGAELTFPFDPTTVPGLHDMSSVMNMTRKLKGCELLILLIALVFTLLVVPLMEDTASARIFFRLGITAVILLAAVATQQRKLLAVVWIYGLVIATPANWATYSFRSPILQLCAGLIESGFFVMMAVMILAAVVRKHLATLQSIYGAMSAYLLLGLAWALLYMGIAQNSAGSWSFRGLYEGPELDGEIRLFSRLVYFSFVTMSTLGYGDIVPEDRILRTLAWMQSVTGQFYIAVLVAWLVSEIPRRRASDESERRRELVDRAPAETEAVDPADRDPDPPAREQA